MFDNTKWFFFMLALHMCSGSPVLADCWRAKSSGDSARHRPSAGRRSDTRSAAFFIIPISSAIGISVSTSRARCAVPHVAAEQAGIGLTHASPASRR